MTTIADCEQGELIAIPHGRFVAESVEALTTMGQTTKYVTLRRVDADDTPIEGDDALLRFNGVEDMVLR